MDFECVDQEIEISMTPNEAAEVVVNTYIGNDCKSGPSMDVLGSYTGMDADGEAPTQDADDL